MSETPPETERTYPDSMRSTPSTSDIKRQKRDNWANAETPRDAGEEELSQQTPRFGLADRSRGQFAKWQCGTEYELVRVLGQGSYGEVAEARQVKTKRRVAIKRIHNVFDVEMDTKRILREVNILRQLKCERIVKLLDIIPPPDVKNFNELYLVFEFVETDLARLINAPQFLTIEHIKYLLYQLLCALKYMHSGCVIHRDIKPANILVNEDCTLKVCDFGLSRVLHRGSNKQALKDDSNDQHRTNDDESTQSRPKQLQRQLTKHVVTRWYRPPELILLQEYSTPVDVWSVGCIFAELLSMQKESIPQFKDRVPLFPGKSCFPLSADNDRTYKDQLDQLNVIFDIIGTPMEEDITNLGEVQNYLKGLQKKNPKDLQKTFPAAPDDAIDLLKRMLLFNPDKRITVEEALKHPFLSSIRSDETETTAIEPIVSIDDLKLNSEGLKAKLLEEIKFYRQ